MLGAKHTVCAWERDGTQPWERKKLTKINALSTQHSTFGFVREHDSPAIPSVPANFELRSPRWACNRRLSPETHRNTYCIIRNSQKQSLRANTIVFPSWLCSAVGSPHTQPERQQLPLGRRRWHLDVCTRPCLHPWKANLVLLFCYIHRCLEHSLEVQAFVSSSLSGHLQSFCFSQRCLAPLL